MPPLKTLAIKTIGLKILKELEKYQDKKNKDSH